MRRFIHICLWTLTGIFATASLSAQNPFTYHKGKTYKDVAAYRMEKNIDLNTYTPSTPIIYEQQVPEHQGTLSYKVALPLYVRGIFFSRDSRPDDYQWPNNTNRYFLGYSAAWKTLHEAIMKVSLPMLYRPYRVMHYSLNSLMESTYSPRPLLATTASAGFKLIRTGQSRCISPRWEKTH